MLEGFVDRVADAFIVDVKLNAPTAVLDRREARLALHAFEHDAAGQRDPDLLAFELFDPLADGATV